MNLLFISKKFLHTILWTLSAQISWIDTSYLEIFNALLRYMQLRFDIILICTFFIISLEVVFSLIKVNPDIEGLQFGSRNTLLIQTTLTFLKNRKSATEVIKTFDKFSLFSGLNVNTKLLTLVSKTGLRWHTVEQNISV